MNRSVSVALMMSTLLLVSNRVFSQPGSKNFGRVWIQGQGLTYTTAFDSGTDPVNAISFLPQDHPPYLTRGNSNICDSAGNPVLISDGFSIYDKNLDIIDGGQDIVPYRIIALYGHSIVAQSSIILPFGDGKYRIVTPTVSDDSCFYNWEQAGNGAAFDLLLYSDVDMNANSGDGKVTRRMVPLLENVRLSKTQMMACRHSDGVSWWLLKQAADTNLVYKFLFTKDRVYGPYIQGFSGPAARFGNWDIDGQSAFSKDGSKYATTIFGYGKVFVADFDRCNGMLSNPNVFKVPAQHVNVPFGPSFLDSSTTGLAFSPDARYIYVSGDYNVQQFDLENPSPSQAWTLLSGPDTTWDQFGLYSNIYSGPDDKVYIGNWNAFGAEMSVIDSPNNHGASASFCRKCLRFPGHLNQGVMRFAGVSIPPCMPNYQLGAANPICYPTGVNAPEIQTAKFTLYPNPSPGTIRVMNSEAGTLQLYDMTGRTVTTFLLDSITNGSSLSLGNLPPGVYQYRFAGRGGQQKSGKLIIIQ